MSSSATFSLCLQSFPATGSGTLMIREKWEPKGTNSGHSMGLFPGLPGRWRPRLALPGLDKPAASPERGQGRCVCIPFPRPATPLGPLWWRVQEKWIFPTPLSTEGSTALADLVHAEAFYCDKLLMTRESVLYQVGVSEVSHVSLTGQFKRHTVSLVAEHVSAAPCSPAPQRRGESKADSQSATEQFSK